MKKILLTTLASGALALGMGSSAEASVPHSASRNCGAAYNGLGVLANTKTSCPFARKTANKYMRSSTSRINVYSNAAHRWVSMYCRTVQTQDSPYISCTGGNDAHVWIVS